MKNNITTINKKVVFIGLSITIFLFIFIISFPNLSHNVFMVANRFGIYSTPYYDLTFALILFLSITIIFIFIGNRHYLKLWLIKAFLTLVLMLAYESIYYRLDSYMYFAEAVHSFNVYVREGGGSTFNIVKINRFFTYFVGDSYHALKLFNSFIGFLGLIFLYKSFEYIMKKNNLKIDHKFIYIFFLFPSVLFWSSILGKDPLNLFFVGMFTYAFIHIIDEFKFRYLIMIILAIWLVSYIRSWYSIIMVTSMFLYYLKINSIRNFSLFLIVLPIFGILGQQFLQLQGITSFDTLFLKMTATTQNLAYGRSAVSTNVITDFWDYLLYYIPNLFTTLFRPMPWDIRNPFTLMAAVENVIMLYLTYKYIFKNWKMIYSNKYLKFLILFIFSWSLLYVIISPANLGGAVRFKLQILPAMLILIGVAMALNQQKEEKT